MLTGSSYPVKIRGGGDERCEQRCEDMFTGSSSSVNRREGGDERCEQRYDDIRVNPCAPGGYSCAVLVLGGPSGVNLSSSNEHFRQPESRMRLAVRDVPKGALRTHSA